MKFISKHWQKIFLAVVISSVSLLYVGGISLIPFHPDEATYLYMSGDLEMLISSPASLMYNPEHPDTLRQYYRLVDPPLTRYIVGIGRVARNLPPPNVDWDWSLSWVENESNGALPDKDMLMAGRLAVALLFPLTLWCIYKIGVISGSTSLGWVAIALLATNSLVLLHTRRAMAEGILLCGLTLSIFVILTLKKYSWLAAIPVALAVNAKFTAAPMLILSLIVIFFIPAIRGERITKRIINAVLLILVFIGVTFLLNPVFWSHPVISIQNAVENRANLMGAQVALFQELNPAQAPSGLGQRLLASMVQAFFSPPSIADVGNYLAYTAEAEREYLAMPVHSFFRGLYAGGVVLFLCLTGMLFWALQITNKSSTYEFIRARLIILLGFFLQGSGLLLFVPLSFQRYQIAMVPFNILFIGLCLLTIYSMVVSLLARRVK